MTLALWAGVSPTAAGNRRDRRALGRGALGRQRGTQALVAIVDVVAELSFAFGINEGRPIKDVDGKRPVQHHAASRPGVDRAIDVLPLGPATLPIEDVEREAAWIL